MEAGRGRLLGEWTVHATKIQVYEFRYTGKDRIGIRLDYKTDNPGEPPREYGLLSVNVTRTSLDPGEFVVKNYDDMKNVWKGMKGFPEFKQTKKKALFREGVQCQLHVFPIWRLRSYDCMEEEEVPDKEGGIVTTSVAECVFEEIKQMIKNVPSNKDIAELLIVLRSFDVHMMKDAINTEMDAD